MVIDDFFCFDGFFSEDELAIFEHAIDQNQQHATVTPAQQSGSFNGFSSTMRSYEPTSDIMARYIVLSHDHSVTELIKTKIFPMFPCPVYVWHTSCWTLYEPWDVHNDWRPNHISADLIPYFQLLIPLDDVKSRTILFDQWSESYNDMIWYKKEHEPLSEPVPLDFWEENLSHCWPQDRQYLSVKACMPWQTRGQLQGFHRRYFHSSDNFHLRHRAKSFISVRLSRDRVDSAQ